MNEEIGGFELLAGRSASLFEVGCRGIINESAAVHLDVAFNVSGKKCFHCCHPDVPRPASTLFQCGRVGNTTGGPPPQALQSRVVGVQQSAVLHSRVHRAIVKIVPLVHETDKKTKIKVPGH